MCVPCFCHACASTTQLCVGVKTLCNTKMLILLKLVINIKSPATIYAVVETIKVNVNDKVVTLFLISINQTKLPK